MLATYRRYLASNTYPIMYIHRRYYFALDRKAGRQVWPLRIRVQWGDHGRHYLNIGVGVSIEPEKWSQEAHRCKANTTHGLRHIPASVINKRITEVEDAIDAAFTEAERAEREPTPTELRTAIDKSLGRQRYTAETLPDLLQRYIFEQSKERQWSDGTVYQMLSFRNQFRVNYPHMVPADLDARFPGRYVADMVAQGLGNVTARDHLTTLRTFALWLRRKGYTIADEFLNEKPRIKTIPRSVIYLTPDELKRLEAADFSGERTPKSLTDAANILLLSSYTGLRISDVAALRPENIHDTYIEVRTKKTGAPLRIELNRHSRAAIERMAGTPQPDGRIAPPMSRNHMICHFMREACRLAGIDSPVSQAHYRGARRIESAGPKWRFVTTHTGRRTFICNALSLGIPPQVVMKWTGHSDYSAMKPYIDIIDAAKASNMARFDSL